MNNNRGQSFIEVLVAVFVIALLTVGIMGVAVLSQRMLVNSERSVMALGIINERKELIQSLVYDDVVIDPAGPISSVAEAVVRNDQTYTLTTNIELIDDPLTAAADDYKKVEIVVEWTAPSGAVRDSSVVTYIMGHDSPEVCTSCETGSCDLTTGVCDSPAAASDVQFEDTFTEASNTELSLHTPDVAGSGWTQIIEVGTTATLQVTGSVGYLEKGLCSNSEGALYQTDDEMSMGDYDVSVVQINGDTWDDFNFLAARAQDANNMYALKWNENNFGFYSPGIYKRQGGAWTRLGYIDGVSVADGSRVTLRVQGDVISMLDDEVEVVSVTDSTFSSPGWAGVGMGAVITGTDDCSSQQLDDFTVSFISGGSCTPGLLCPNGALCPLTRVCPGDTTIPLYVPDDGPLCRMGEICSSGALCPLSGICPTRSCPDGACPSGNACFSGFCYPWEWYNLTFEPADPGNPADSVAMECKGDVCSDTFDCQGNCQSDCQYIESDGFMGCGRWQVVKECRRTWIPDCREAVGGGAVESCRGGYDEFGNCVDLECLPVACPAGGARSWCANGEECGLTSSNDVCISDNQCPAGEMCDAGLGQCRTICSDKAECSSYWGGWAKGCSSKAIVAGPSDCVNGGGSCSGPAGDCAAESLLSLVTVEIENVNPGDYSEVLANPVEVLEGDSPDLTEVAFRVILSGPILDTVAVRVDSQDGLATGADGDYSGSGVTLTFEPGGSLEQTAVFNVVGDDVPERDENFSAVITKARSIYHEVAGVGETAEVVIVNDDITVEIADTSVIEGDPGDNNQAVFTVTRRGSARAPVDMILGTADGTALAGSDYTARSSVNLTIEASTSLSLTGEVTVDVTGDTAYEPDEEYFFMNIESADLDLTGLTGLDALIDTAVIVDGQGKATIADDDNVVDIEGDVVAYENDGSLLFTLRLRRDIPGSAVHVRVSTQDGTPPAGAAAGSDYVALVLEQVTIPASQLSKTVSVEIINDAISEPDENFTLRIDSVDSIDGVGVGVAVGTGTIVDDDSSPPETIYSASMDGNPGWTYEGQWSWGVPTGGSGDHGGPDPTSGYSGNSVVGYNLSGGYENNISLPYWASTGAIDTSGYVDVGLSFQRWLGVERSSYDHVRIEVSNDGVNWTLVWENPNTTLDEQSWTEQAYDISAIADNQATVFIRWGMGATDGSWTYSGWNIDDVLVTGSALSP